MNIIRQRDRETGLWIVPLDNTWMSIMMQQYRKSQGKISNNVYQLSKNYDATQYLHASAFSTVKSTFIKAIEAGNFTTWPNLTAHHVKQYLKKAEVTIKGHMNQQRKNARSTRPKEKSKTKDTGET
jgi:hypothetical protein